jgi:hypothetical protein
MDVLVESEDSLAPWCRTSLMWIEWGSMLPCLRIDISFHVYLVIVLCDGVEADESTWTPQKKLSIRTSSNILVSMVSFHFSERVYSIVHPLCTASKASRYC